MGEFSHSPILLDPLRNTLLQQIVDDLLLIRRNRVPEIKLESEIPDIRLSEKEGLHQTIFLEILGLLEKFNTEIKENTIDIKFDFRPHKSELIITFTVVRSFIESEKLLKVLDSDILWKYLCREAFIGEIFVDSSTIQFSTKTFPPDNTFASQALEAYETTSMLSRSENQTTSQLLHDLKNQLIAYQVSLDSAGKDRTSIFRAKFEASQHLDNAITICHSLEAVSNSMASPTIELIDVGELVRAYMAEKLTALPLNIRLETPKSTGSGMVYTSRDFLKSIFENLIKNAVEAMPTGGEIRVDWLYDDSAKLLMIDVSDTGPGLSSEIIEKLKSGRLIESSKHKGSGIGILSVQSMVERLGGSCSISSNRGKGTQWNIILPSMVQQESPDEGEIDQSLENMRDIEVELE